MIRPRDGRYAVPTRLGSWVGCRDALSLLPRQIEFGCSNAAPCDLAGTVSLVSVKPSGGPYLCHTPFRSEAPHE